MSENDDIEKLLREIDGVTAAQPPARRPDSAPKKAADDSGGGQAMALVISAVIGVVGLLLGFLPWVPGIWLGLGGFLGSYLGIMIGRRFG